MICPADDNAASAEGYDMELVRRIVSSSVHPDTGELIPIPFRINGFALCATPIVAAMLIPGMSVPCTVGVQVNN